MSPESPVEAAESPVEAAESPVEAESDSNMWMGAIVEVSARVAANHGHHSNT